MLLISLATFFECSRRVWLSPLEGTMAESSILAARVPKDYKKLLHTSKPLFLKSLQVE